MPICKQHISKRGFPYQLHLIPLCRPVLAVFRSPLKYQKTIKVFRPSANKGSLVTKTRQYYPGKRKYEHRAAEQGVHRLHLLLPCLPIDHVAGHCHVEGGQVSLHQDYCLWSQNLCGCWYKAAISKILSTSQQFNFPD